MPMARAAFGGHLPWMAVLLVIILLTVGTAAVAWAGPDCTEQYLLCLNDAEQYGTTGAVREMANIECAAEWTGCAISKLKFW